MDGFRKKKNCLSPRLRKKASKSSKMPNFTCNFSYRHRVRSKFMLSVMGDAQVVYSNVAGLITSIFKKASYTYIIRCQRKQG